MSTQKIITVEVAYAEQGLQKLLKVDLAAESSAYDAIIASKLLESCPQIDLTKNKIGVLGKAIKKAETHILRNGDRVEIYRPLISQPAKVKKSG